MTAPAVPRRQNPIAIQAGRFPTAKHGPRAAEITELNLDRLVQTVTSKGIFPESLLEDK